MRHPTDGTLRRLVDDPAGVPDADRAHVAGCPTCLGGLAAAQQDATAVATALHTGALHTEALHTQARPDGDRAFPQLTARLAGDAHAASPVTAPRRRRQPLRSPVVAALGVVLVLGGA